MAPTAILLFVYVCVRVKLKQLILTGLFLRQGYFPGKRRVHHNHAKQTIPI